MTTISVFKVFQYWKSVEGREHGRFESALFVNFTDAELFLKNVKPHWALTGIGKPCITSVPIHTDSLDPSMGGAYLRHQNV